MNFVRKVLLGIETLVRVLHLNYDISTVYYIIHSSLKVCGFSNYYQTIIHYTILLYYTNKCFKDIFLGWFIVYGPEYIEYWASPDVL